VRAPDEGSDLATRHNELVVLPDPIPPARETRSVAVLMLTTFLAAGAVVVAAGAIGGIFSSPKPAGSASGPVVSRVQDEIVDIDTVLEQNLAAAGTGMVLTPDGEVLTNNHVIQGASTITATDIGNGRTYTASVVGYDERRDVAVLRLDGAADLPSISLGDSDAVSTGMRVVTIGNAEGLGGTPASKTGVVLARDQAIAVADDLDGTSEHLSQLIEIRGDLEPGDSGGPMIDGAGAAVGMDTAASQSYQFSSGAGLGFAIEINPVKRIARQILAGRGTSTIHIGQTAFIGVRINTSDSSRAGAPIEGAVQGSPAAAAGIARGDLIVEFAGRPIASATALTAALVPYHPGQRVAIAWLTPAGVRQTATIRLAKGPSA
jgi:S1-C subfamily serine protease